MTITSISSGMRSSLSAVNSSRVAAILVVFALPAIALAQGARQERTLKLLQERYVQRHAEFAQEMNELATFCEAESFFTDAEQIRLRAQPVAANLFDIDALPDRVLPLFPVDLPDAEQRWRTKLRKIEKDYAIDLYRLSREALKSNHPSFAFQLVREVAFHDPDHKWARQLLGFVRFGDEWTTPFSRTMRSRGYVDHPQFGWISKRHVNRYENGERIVNGRWVSVEKEALLRSQFQNGWEVETEHFYVKTNHSLEKGVEIARALEGFHRFFIREFAGFFNSPQQMQKLFDEGASTKGSTADRYRVYYFRNKQEFVESLKKRQPNIEIANGLYMPADRIAYFFHDDSSVHSETMYHEVTHQLLGESSSRQVDVGMAADFWVIEGIACYMESFRNGEFGIRIGDVHHHRIFWARRKATEEGFYIPMRQFMGFGMNEFQRPPSVDLLHAYYSQATGMSHFFLHYQDGIYRDAFIDYLSQVYSPVNRVRNNASLETLIGVSLETLDQQYLEYIKSLPANPLQDVQLMPVDETAEE